MSTATSEAASKRPRQGEPPISVAASEMPSHDTAAILTAASERPRRGRPAAIDTDWLEPIVALVSDGESARSKQNARYQFRALAVLHRQGVLHPRFEWLMYDKDVRVSILTELGRIENENDLRVWAAALCREKPKAKDAIARVRRWRLHTKDEPPDLKQLADQLAEVINRFRARHPSATKGDVAAVLRALLDAVRNLDSPTG